MQINPKFEPTLAFFIYLFLFHGVLFFVKLYLVWVLRLVFLFIHFFPRHIATNDLCSHLNLWKQYNRRPGLEVCLVGVLFTRPVSRYTANPEHHILSFIFQNI